MNIIPVDYNAATPAGSLRLNFTDTREALAAIAAQSGDWIWASDGEVLVGAQLHEDPSYGFVAAPNWRTLVHLDDYDESESIRFIKDFEVALQPQRRNIEEQERAFQMLMIWINKMAPPVYMAANLIEMTRDTAVALYEMGEYGLALSTITQSGPGPRDYPYLVFLHLKMLWLTNPDRAAAEARERAKSPDADALVLAACIDIGTATSELLPDPEFRSAVRLVLDWIERFDRAPGRDQIYAIPLAQVHLNRGLILLRLGQRDEADEAFRLAHAIDPIEPAIIEALALQGYDEKARQIGPRSRSKPAFNAA